MNLSSQEFEQFCISLLRLLGYQEPGHGQRRGTAAHIDGQGIPAGRCHHSFRLQASLEQTPVGRPAIDRFRGAIQGDYDHGVFSDRAVHSGAEAASIKKGAISLLLLDGEAIAETMIRSGIGVTRRPIHPTRHRMRSFG
jgi:restriction system protein